MRVLALSLAKDKNLNRMSDLQGNHLRQRDTQYGALANPVLDDEAHPKAITEEFTGKSRKFAVLLHGHPPRASTIHSMSTWFKYGKIYSTSLLQKRRSAWQTPVAEIAAHNAKGLSWTQALNEFSDYSWEEFKTHVLMEPQDCSATGGSADKFGDVLLQDSVDWSTQINSGNWPVKMQGQCGSCWTFSTAGTLEAHHYLQKGAFVNVSEQQLVDCAGAFNNNGCSGGLPSQAFEYIMYNGGIDSEAQYSYLAHNGTHCAYDSKPVATVKSVVNVTYLDEESIVKALNADAKSGGGPVSIAYQVAHDFRNYHSGVYDGNCSSAKTDVNHAVVAVGFGTMDGKDYFKVRNSWGKTFGVDGYFMIERGENKCGLADCASYPEV